MGDTEVLYLPLSKSSDPASCGVRAPLEVYQLKSMFAPQQKGIEGLPLSHDCWYH